MLTIPNLLFGRNWRSREKQISRYVDRVWKRRGGRIEFASQNELIAVDGLLTSPSNEEPPWKRLVKKNGLMSQLAIFLIYGLFFA